MTAIRRFSFMQALAMMIVALGLSTAPAAAQSVTGTFKLPMAAKWGTSFLPAGEYSYSAEISNGMPIVTVRSVDTKWAQMFLAQSVSAEDDSKPATLELTRQGDTLYVSSISARGMGLVFNYALPKVVEAPAVAQLEGASERRH
jgi:hypothetical protein